MAKTLSEEHRKNISESLKMRWERGDFDSDEIRDIWRRTALSGIAKKGKPSSKKFVPSQEMIDDYSKMGDKELSQKWGVSRRLVIKIRKEYSLASFNHQHDLRPHQFIDGKEYKWCGSGHWELVENFGVHSSRYDGLRGHCKTHSNESSRRAKQKEYSTPEGKAKIRFNNNRRKTSIILWEYRDERRAMQLYEKRCGYCGTPITYKTVEFDHLVPVSRGGHTVPANMIPSCVNCNRGVGGKKAKDVLPWLMKKFGESLGLCVYNDIMAKQLIIAQETKDRLESIRSV